MTVTNSHVQRGGSYFLYCWFSMETFHLVVFDGVSIESSRLYQVP